MSKAQVTIFAILGVILVAIFGFALFAAQSAQEKKIEATVEKPIADFIKSKAVNYYVTSCLDKVSKEALVLIGEQGGFIHKEQNSLINWHIPYIEYNSKNVSYQIYSSSSGKLKIKDTLIFDSYLYPCFTKGPLELNGIDCHKIYSYNNPNQDPLYFGSTKEPVNKINPDLCKEKIIIPAYVCSCFNPPNSLNCKYSIQAQLEDYVEKKVEECVDFSNIKEYNISKGHINATVTFGKTSVLFKIDFPITITVKDSEPIIKVLEFSAEQPVRFKNIYALARDLIDKDIDDINFNILTDGQQLANHYEGLEIKRDSTTYTNASIITIEDYNSKIDGKNYVFMFARENRAPALDYMEFISFNGYDLYIIENQTLNFTPTAFDPDEYGITNPLIYNYSSSDWSSVANALKASSIYINPGPGECVHPFSKVSEKERCATYDLTEADVGEHILNITPKDPGWLFDYQNISILVDDIPGIDLVLNNEFDDIDNNFTSIEDRFIFNASKTNDIYPEPVTLQFKWKHIKPDGTTILIQDWNYNNIIYFPEETPDIDDMTGFFDALGIHNITLEVKNEQTPEPTPLENIAINKSEIMVYECLPHRNPNAAPYPYNQYKYDSYTDDNVPYDPKKNFLANHACCKGTGPAPDLSPIWGTLQDSTFTCYEFETYTCGPPDDISSGEIPPANFAQHDFGTKSLHPANNYNVPRRVFGTATKNAVYKRVFTQKCSKRGNACSGDAQDDWYIQFDCDTKTGTEDESCQGPCDTDDCYNKCIIEVGTYGRPDTIDIGSTCKKFTWPHSWEKTARKKSWANSVCNEEWNCAMSDDPSISDYGDGSTGAQWLCQGGCDDGDCTFPANCQDCYNLNKICIVQNGDDICGQL